ncbi:hypothetical protein DJ83_16920 [Halorubrum ezzemoulense]|uniref:Uncharacterized protein n=1 Tax=Halorubrum ezzemoulense TaxID=337243 RepID=A0A256IMP8_HALEZ|nr:hypothetical protein DJ83_16920 [Halorubrum ezzemoulense]
MTTRTRMTAVRRVSRLVIEMSDAVECVAENTGMSEEAIIEIAHKLAGQSIDDESQQARGDDV